MLKYLFGFALALCCAACINDSSNQIDAGLSDRADEILKKVDTMTNTNQGREALLYLDSAYKTLDNPSVKESFERFHARFTYYHLVAGDALNANLYADSMLYTINNWQNHYKVEYANALFDKGDAIFMSKLYNNAFNYYFEAQRFAIKNLDRCATYGFTYRLGLVRFKQERYLEAIYFFKQAFIEGENCDDRKTLFDTYFSRHSYLNSIGICFERIDKLDSALSYYNKSLNFINRVPEEYEFRKNFVLNANGVVYGNLGGVYSKLGQYNLAEKYLKESIAINDRPNFDEVDALTAKIKLGELYYKYNQLKKVDTVLKSLRLAVNRKDPGKEMPVETKLQLYNLEWRYLDKMNRLPEAYQRLQLYYGLRDSLSKAGRGLKSTDIDMSFRNNEQQYKLNILSQENNIQASYLVASTIFLIVVLTISLILWYNRYRLKKLNIQITEQNIQMQKVLTALEQSQRENTRMMQIVAHDLRSPLAAAISITTLLKSADLTPDEHKMLDLLQTSSNHSLDLIADLLNINTSSADLKTESIELNSLITYCINLLEFKAKEKAQNLIFSGINVNIRAHSGKIWRVVSNLIVNAIKFSPIGSDIEIELFKAENEIVVKVKDHGIGIPIDHKERIFDIFTDAKRQGTAGEHSFGIGLAISKQIIEAHHGDIWFESKINEGSTFYVSLPL